MTVRQVLTLYYDGLSGDDKPTGVPRDTRFLETDTRAMYVTPDNGATWVLDDQRVRLVKEDGTYIDLPGFSEAKSNYGSSTGAVLTVDLDTGVYGGRLYAEVWVKSSAAATFTVYGSRDNSNWREVDTIVLDEAGEASRGYDNAYRYIRVATTDANNNEAEIVASR